MLIDKFKKIYRENKEKDPYYIRNLLKEVVQYYVLNFISSSKWNENLVFKGGTALRFCFDLPRLSEDLDFDVENYKDFDIEKFAMDLSNYLTKDLKYSKFTYKITNSKRTLYLKFPILNEIGMPIKQGDSNILHMRIDFAEIEKTNYTVEISTKNAYGLSFFMRRFSLSDLFAAKIAAILTRMKMEGTELVERYKGRDYFDLIWFLEQKVVPNPEIVKKMTNYGIKETVSKLNEKVDKITVQDLQDDLFYFFSDSKYVETFAKNYKELAKEYLKNLK